MQFRAKAKTPGRCCYVECHNAGNKIYQDENYKYLACSRAHAVIVQEIIEKNPDEFDKWLKSKKN